MYGIYFKKGLVNTGFFSSSRLIQCVDMCVIYVGGKEVSACPKLLRTPDQ